MADMATLNQIFPDGRVSVTFALDGTTHILSGIPLEDRAGFRLALARYLRAYKRGLVDVTPPTVDPTITAAVGVAAALPSPPPE